VSSPIRLWLSRHDSWEAWVAEHGDGTFTAWACRAGSDAVAIYVEDSFEQACAAACFDLQRLAPEHTCGPQCNQWEPRPLP
jgi:hypothetical protein